MLPPHSSKLKYKPLIEYTIQIRELGQIIHLYFLGLRALREFKCENRFENN